MPGPSLLVRGSWWSVLGWSVLGWSVLGWSVLGSRDRSSQGRRARGALAVWCASAVYGFVSGSVDGVGHAGARGGRGRTRRYAAGGGP
ncbi:hypothetical protein [Nonomuraea salmonea]|uniref:Uncharacterized protein n=1 Tax=Nonomuraea salmonea TaxID=46181 RepID=A0ABV5P0B1_9ACTN